MAESGIIGSFISGKVMGGIQSKLAGGGSSQSQQPRRAGKAAAANIRPKARHIRESRWEIDGNCIFGTSFNNF